MLRAEIAAAAKRGVSTASGLPEAAPTRLPAKLLNNAAVLQLRAGRVAAALALMQEALLVRSGFSGELEGLGHAARGPKTCGCRAVDRRGGWCSQGSRHTALGST